MKLNLLVTGLILTGLAATAHADITWDWSYTYSTGEADTGSGTFTTGGTESTSGISGNTGYLVTSITGAFHNSNGTYPVNYLGNAGDQLYGYAPMDNLLIPTGGGSAQVDGYGLAFHNIGSPYEYKFYDAAPGTDMAIGLSPTYAFTFSEGTLVITEAAPEPAAWLGGATVLAIAVGARTRRFRANRTMA